MPKLSALEPSRFACRHTAKLYILETRMWNFIVARALLAVLVALSAAALRQALSLKFSQPPCPASTLPSVSFSHSAFAATSLQSGLLNCPLEFGFGCRVQQESGSIFSLLTVNAVIFDSLGGSILLLSALASLSLIESFKPIHCFTLDSCHFSACRFCLFVIDSLFLQQVHLATRWNPLPSHYHIVTFVKGLDYIKLLSSLKPAELLNSKHFANILIILIPALIVYAIGRANRYTRAMLSLYTLSAIEIWLSLTFPDQTRSWLALPMLGPLFVATSISVLGFIRTHKSLTFLFFGILIPALGWSLGRVHWKFLVLSNSPEKPSWHSIVKFERRARRRSGSCCHWLWCYR